MSKLKYTPILLMLLFYSCSSSDLSSSRQTASQEDLNNGFCTDKIPNPCFAQRGKPYRKYKCFAYQEGNRVIAYKSESKFKTYPNHESVEAFLNKSGILAANCDGSPAPPPRQPTTGQNPHPSRPQTPHQNNNEATSLPLKDGLVKHYYGRMGPRTWPISDDNILSFPIKRDKKINYKQELHKILTLKHIQKKGQFDYLVNKCPENLDLGEICVGQKSYSYKRARQFLFGQIHLVMEGDKATVEDVYCNRYISKDDYTPEITKLPGPMKVPDHQVINCEHTWPKSRFNPNQPRNVQLTDLHHLYPTDTKVNRIRSNYLFGEVNPLQVRGETHKQCNYHLMGNAIQVEGIPDSGNTNFFSPPKQHRGNVARALFYFSVRYDNPISPLEEHYLRKWHKEDPVDAAEVDRVQQIYLLQGLRNPFVDYPELVDSIKDF